MAHIIDPTRQSPQEETKILTPYNIKTPEEFFEYVLNDMAQLAQGFEYNRTTLIQIVGRLNQIGIASMGLDQRLSGIEKFLTEKFGYERPELILPELPKQTQEVIDAEKEELKHAFPPHPHFGNASNDQEQH